MRFEDTVARVFLLASMLMLGIAAGVVVVRSRSASSALPTPPTQHHVLVSPYASRPFLRGQLHAHSSRAIGRSFPRDVARAYQRLGYAWVSVTDQNTVTPTNMWDTPGMGQLIGEEVDYRFGSFLVYGVDHDALASSPADVMTWVHSAAGIAILARPLAAPNLTYQQVTSLRNLNGIEIFDARLAHDMPAQGDASKLWDRLLSDGHHVWGVVGDDSIDVTGQSTAGQTSVYVQALDTSAVLLEDAIDRGAFIDSVGGLQILGVAADGGQVIVVTDSADQITFYGKGGKQLQQTRGRKATYDVRWDESYVRVVATKSDGARAYTQPVFVIP